MQNIYAKVPAIECRGLCQHSCTGVAMFPAERAQIANTLGGPPVPYFERQGFNGYRVCPLLKGGQCTVYADRPLVCRLYGVVDEMPCPHGCEPVRRLTEPQFLRLMGDIAGVA